MTTKNYDGSMYPRVVNTMSALDVEDMSFVRVKIQKKKKNPPTNIMADTVSHGVMNDISG